MPFGKEGIEDGTALALSGGGFRAALFHVGALWRLNELGVLRTLKRISSVSGGSITAGVLGLQWSALDFGSDGVARSFVQRVVDPLRAFCNRRVDALAIGEGALMPWKTVADAVREEYEQHLFGTATLQDLPGVPRFVINSTSLQTGRSFRFSKPYAGDYRIGLIRSPTLRLSLAVTASSAFPPFLSPVEIELPEGSFEATEGADLNGDTDFTRKIALTDGGAYDNLGLETVWNRYRTVLVSDAGAPFPAEPSISSVWDRQAMRAFEIATDQARGLRKRSLVADYVSGARTGTYWGIATDIAGYGLADALMVPLAKTRRLAAIRTRLNPFSEPEQSELINWGYAVADAALRRHVLASQTPACWPYPAYALD